MTTPREPRGSSGYGRDAYDRDPDRWSDEPEPPVRYGGEYGSDRDYGWPQPEYAPPPHLPRTGAGGRQSRPSARRVAAARRRTRLLPAIAVVVVVVVVLVLGFLTPGWFVTRVLDPAAVQRGVTKVLGDDYAIEGVADVRCPGGVQVIIGATFTCDATIDGDPVKVPVRVTGSTGGYQVGRPT